jgi:hypothetical protein
MRIMKLKIWLITVGLMAMSAALAPAQWSPPDRDAKLGRFLFSKQGFDMKDDPFHCSPSIISYDCGANAQVTQDSRAWIAGLGDEADSGSWLAAAMKEYSRPDKQQDQKFEQFVDGVLWGEMQFKDGPNKFGVRKSLFYYQPDQLPNFSYRKDLDWSSWVSWNKQDSEGVWRSYNYPHVVAAYWSLYRIVRNHPGMATHHDWRWYLTQAYETIMAMTRFTGDHAPLAKLSIERGAYLLPLGKASVSLRLGPTPRAAK